MKHFLLMIVVLVVFGLGGSVLLFSEKIILLRGGVPHLLVGKEAFRTLPHSEKDAVIKKLTAVDPKATWRYLVSVSTDGDEVVYNAHNQAHIVGNSLYDTYGIEAISVCTDEFSFGCFHGVTEAFIASQGIEAIAAADAGCRQAFPEHAGVDERRYFNCIHGIGHGLLVLEGYRIKQALEDCGRLDRPSWCYHGVFMENSDFAPASLFDVSDNPWNLCSELSPQYHQACAWFQPLFLKRVYGYAPAQVAASCLAGPTDKLRLFCIRQVGARSAENHRDDIRKVLADCNQFTEAVPRGACVTGAAGIIVHYRFKNWEEESISLCSSLSGASARDCTEYRDEMIREYIR